MEDNHFYEEVGPARSDLPLQRNTAAKINKLMTSNQLYNTAEYEEGMCCAS